MSRRAFILGAGAAAVSAIPTTQAESQENSVEFLSSPLTQKELDTEKADAVRSLTEKIPAVPQAAYLRDFARKLPLESQMYIPNAAELKDVISKSNGELAELTRLLKVGTSGLFAFADIQKNQRRMHRMYVVRRNSANQLQFIKAYRISMARYGFGNEPDSEQTPLGIHTIESGTQGLLGEVVSQLNKYKDLLNVFPIDGKDRWFVKGFGTEVRNNVVEVVTDQYLLKGPTTDTSRGIRIHGTNRSGEIGENGEWKSLLDGAYRSSACLRMANVDVRNLTLSGLGKKGTLVMIHATPEAKRMVAPKVPAEWVPPVQTETKKVAPARPSGGPPEWIPPR